METAAPTFKCRYCEHDSRYTDLADDSGGLRASLYTARESRIYRCENCQAENGITLTAEAWSRVDSNSQYPGNAPPVGREVAFDAKRGKLEENLREIRDRSAAIAAAAFAAGAMTTGVTQFGEHPTNASNVLYLIGLILTVGVILAAIANSIPLRQTARIVEKVPQLRMTLAWRQRLLLACATGLGLAIVMNGISAVAALL